MQGDAWTSGRETKKTARFKPQPERLLRSGLNLANSGGVSDGTRTRDPQDHNLVFYQLNYTHHNYVSSALSGFRISSGGNTSGSNCQ